MTNRRSTSCGTFKNLILFWNSSLSCGILVSLFVNIACGQHSKTGKEDYQTKHGGIGSQQQGNTPKDPTATEEQNQESINENAFLSEKDFQSVSEPLAKNLLPMFTRSIPVEFGKLDFTRISCSEKISKAKPEITEKKIESILKNDSCVIEKKNNHI
jgi:hypothetical protein